MEDYSSNEKVKPEKHRRKLYYAFWSVCIYIHMCNVCIELFIYILLLNLLFQPSCLEVITGNAYVCFRYLPLEELLLELDSNSFSSQSRDRNLWGAWPHR